MAYFYIFITIALTVYGQLIIKWRMSLAGELPVEFIPKISFLVMKLFDPWIITGLAGAMIAALAWMAAMTKLDLSHAYPFVSVTFPVVVILSGLFFKEPVGLYKIAGALMIVVGVIVGSRG